MPHEEMTSSVPSSASFGAEQPPHMQFQNRYHFNNVGVVKEILYPNKAIIGFKLNGKDEKAILLSKVAIRLVLARLRGLLF